jgi:hypothetical protein
MKGVKSWQRPDPAVRLEPQLTSDCSLLTIVEGKPFLFAEKQYRLLTEPLWTSWQSPDGRPFHVMSNMCLYFTYKGPPLTPDLMFIIDVEAPTNPREGDHRTYFSWVVGKPPDIIIEIVSDDRGREETDKLKAYERIGTPFYRRFPRRLIASRFS